MTTEDKTDVTPKHQWGEILGRWRSWLEHDQQRGARAELKRGKQVSAVLCQPAALRLYGQLREHPWCPDAETVGVIAGVAPWLKRTAEAEEDTRETEGKSPVKEPELPKILGQSSKGERPLFSELRFKRLLESRDSDELMQQLRRALAQTNGSGHWLHLVDTVTQCHRQWAMPEKFTGSQQWQYRWSNMYYTEVFKYLKEVKS